MNLDIVSMIKKEKVIKQTIIDINIDMMSMIVVILNIITLQKKKKEILKKEKYVEVKEEN